MSEIQRYLPCEDRDGPAFRMVPDQDFGTHVLFTDHAQALAAKDAEIERLKSENKELNDLFDMRWKRDMEAVAIWRAAAPGRELSMPDRADMVTFLLDELAAKDARIRELEEAIRVLGKFFYEASGGHGYSAIGFSDAIDAVLANPIAAKAVDVQT